MDRLNVNQITLTPECRAKLAVEVAEHLFKLMAADIKKQPIPISDAVPRRLTVIEFAACCRLAPETIRTKIRCRTINPKMVEGRPSGTYYLDRAALAGFNIPLEVAAERLAEHRAKTLAPISQPPSA